MASEAYVARLPKCDYCASEGNTIDAQYDGATVDGPWANMCTEHFVFKSRGLGTGRGQRLKVGEPPERDRHEEARKALANNDFAAFEEAVGDGDPLDYM